MTPRATNAAASNTAADAQRLALRLDRAADNLAAGNRETPQRFIPVACRAARDLNSRIELLRYLLSETIEEAAIDDCCVPEITDLLRQILVSMEQTASPDNRASLAMEADLLRLAPRITRRRSRHCHGQVASDRRLLLGRTIVEEMHEWRRTTPERWHNLYLALAYAMSNHDQDHFDMIGPDVERRLRRLARWVEREQQPE